MIYILPLNAKFYSVAHYLYFHKTIQISFQGKRGIVFAKCKNEETNVPIYRENKLTTTTGFPVLGI